MTVNSTKNVSCFLLAPFDFETFEKFQIRHCLLPVLKLSEELGRFNPLIQLATQLAIIINGPLGGQY